VTNLNTPDIIGLQEVQDNSGSTNDGVISADVTLQTLVDAIATAGGPTYEFIDNPFIGNNTSGGQPGANIRTAFLYNPARIELVEGSVQTVGGQANDEAFFETRLPLIADFTFNGETVTVVNNHFSSKGGSSPLFGVNQPSVGDEVNGNGQEDPAINGSLNQRRAQAQVVNDFVDSVLTNNADANVVVLGDFNEFEFISPLEILAGDVLTNLVETLPDTERYSFIFDGNSQALDHILVTNNLSAKAQVDIVQLNTEFVDNAQRASDHDPILAQLSFANPMTTNFTLQLFHTSDQEAGVPALNDAPRFSAVLNALLNQDLDNDGNAGFDNTLILSSGDAYIPGLFFNASAEVFGGAGRGDILIQNALGFQAIAFGNHEFDFGTGLVKDLIAGDAEDNFPGTNFPYLSSNLDFSTDANLAGLVVPDGQAPQPNSIAATTVIDVNGEKIGVVGATTPALNIISNPGDVIVNPTGFDSGIPTPEQLDALAAEIQQDVDQLLTANPDINKVVLLAHMQILSIEQELATRLSNVDIIVAGGSNTRLVDETDRLRDGDTAQGVYPIIKTDVDGNPVAVVNTDGNYKYVGRLVIDFDANGVIIPESYDPAISGAYATDDQGVEDLGAEGLIDPEIQGIVDQLRTVILATESNVFGVSDVYLAGLRGDVRIQETNLGNLTADANLAIAKAADSNVVISLKNGGGIRDDIGQVIVPPGGTGEAERLPTEEVRDADGNVVKPAGGISQTDIANALRFNNGLTLLTVTAQELVDIIEHGFAASSPDDSNQQGRFPQVSGLGIAVDLTRDPGDRLVSLAIEDETGKDLDVVVKEGEIVGDASRTFRMVTLNFLAGGGDGYPFPTGDGANRIDLSLPDEAPRTGVATFAPDGSEQDALAEYLAANFSTPETAFNQADTPRDLDTRIQNLAFREDTVIDPLPPVPVGELVFGSPDADILIAGSDFIGINDTLFTGGGDDEVDILFGGAAAGNNRINTGSGADVIFVGNGDRANAGSGDDEIDATDATGYRLSGGAGNDIFFLGASGRALGGDGDDQFYVGEGGDNLLSGGAGADQFWLLTDTLPTDANIVTDFTQGTDVIGIANQGSGVDFNSLSFSGNSIALNGNTFATLLGIETTALTTADFVFM
jgi:2',3'-cyclic-nucleotide 2'-phosphodiesterase (5'-nucleotidase family)